MGSNVKPNLRVNLVLDGNRELYHQLCTEAEETRRSVQDVIRDRLDAAFNPNGAAAQFYKRLEASRGGSYYDRMKEEDRPS